ncbi:apoptosis-inducing factor 1, mitochondrial [Onthophagus taurus]|uniref:apoptosis-inducing factor 1, mitochondrial n=1 Tax=Onthophagus taurus TaxID=166361 RepID=UPI0039BE933F
MLRFRHLATFGIKSARPIKLSPQNSTGPQTFFIAHRYYSRPPNKDNKNIPSLQECIKPNEMSKLPKLECAFDAIEAEHRRRNRNILIIGLLFAALSIGALVLYLNATEDKPPKRKPKPKRPAKPIKGVPIKNPANSGDIPAEVPYLLIGGGTAAFSAFRAIKSSDPTAQVLVVSADGFYPYMRPPLSKELWFGEDESVARNLEFKQWNGSQRSLFYEPDDFYVPCRELLDTPNGGVAVARGWSISHLDVVERIAYLENGQEIKYGKCLIATGASPKNLDVFENAEDAVKENVTIYRDVYDFKYMFDILGGAKAIAIVGGGFLGSELACAFGRKFKKEGTQEVYQIFKEGGNMGKVLPEYLSFWTTDKIKHEGVHVLTNSEVMSAVPSKDRVKLTLNNGKDIIVDKVVVAVGVEPNTQIAEKSDLETDPDLGGYLVNTELQARSNLYIAGDCACFYDVKLGRRRVEHHDHAVISGRLAGENMTGGAKPYLHQSMFWSDLGPEVGYEAIGIIDSTLPTVGVFAKASDKDNPKAVITASDDGLRSETVPPECKKYAATSPEAEKKAQDNRREMSKPMEGEDFGKGVIFYLRDDIVVGIVLWNVFNRMQIARQVLKDERKYEDLNEVAKLFNIHED